MTATKIAATLAILALAACSNTVSSLTYHPPATMQPAAAPRIANVEAIDQRKEAPNRLATIMGGYGNPLKTLDTAKPVKDEVADAFASGLRARTLSGMAAPCRLVLTIRKFDADMVMGSTARLDMTASVVDRDGRRVFEQPVQDSTSDFAFFKTGMFADIADLQRMCQVVLDRSVDKVLDNPEFRTAIGTGRAATASNRSDRL